MFQSYNMNPSYLFLNPNCNVVAVECKRYKQKSELNKRYLLGEIAQAFRSIPDLDVWVLVASRSIPSQLKEDLHADAKSRGIECIHFKR